MKTVLAWIALLALLFPGVAEIPAPPTAVSDPEGIAEAALPIMTLLASCPSFYSFELAPPEALAREVQGGFPQFLEEIEPSDVLDAVFACPPAEIGGANPIPSRVPTLLEIESAIDTGTGRVRASVRVSQDVGFGYEFCFYADFTLLPGDDAPCGARVESVFIPD